MKIGLILGLLISPAWGESPIIDVKQIAGKSVDEVATILGQPVACRDTYQGLSCDYKSTDTEIIYINDKADWITIGGFEELEYNYRAIEKIGLRPVLPVVQNPFRMHWDSHQGFAIVSVYSSGRYVVFIQVRAFTPK